MRWIMAWMLLIVVPLLQAEELVGRLVKITDGDTFILVDGEKNRHVIRLQGIDAPELPQPFAMPSKQKLREMVKEKDIVVHWECKDKQDRIQGDVFVGDLHINLIMIQEGLAWYDRKPPRNKVFAEAEAEAKMARKGLWHDPHPVPPWEFRRTVYWP